MIIVEIIKRYNSLLRRMGCFIILNILLNPCINAQVLFYEDCWRGGVFTSGLDRADELLFFPDIGRERWARIKWGEDYKIRNAYALTYRVGSIPDHFIFINGTKIKWSMNNIIGPQIFMDNAYDQYFGVHAVDISDQLEIIDDSLEIHLPKFAHHTIGSNGWEGVYIIVTYESAQIGEDMCLQVYTANQDQRGVQNYLLQTPHYDINYPLVLGIHSGRKSENEEAGTLVRINHQSVGHFWGGDLLWPTVKSGTQGHYFYELGECGGLNGDTCNHKVYYHDATAMVQSYIDANATDFELRFSRIPNGISEGKPNMHPSFNLAFKPTCPPITSSEMPRAFSLCRGEIIEFSGVDGFDHYAWSPALQLNDSTLMNPTCTPDSSRWYRLRMWNDDPAQGCPLTIPVWVEVGQTPRPGTLTVVQSSCPSATGSIRFLNTAGTPPFTYTAGGATNATGFFTQRPPGSYPISVTDALGCTWDSVAVVKLNTHHTAAFGANPTAGVSPLQVLLSNQSTGANGYQWLVDDEPFSTTVNTAYTFANPGTYTVSLVATLNTPACADTATVTILVDTGIELVVPNIFTPNSDGVNDVLVAQSTGAVALSWQVYNRWGKVLHTGTANPPGHEPIEVALWDGLTPAGSAPDGTYMVVVTATGLTGKVEQVQVAVGVRK